MNRNELTTLIKSFCDEHKYKFVDDIQVGNSVLVLIRSQDCAKALDLFLTEQGLEHTTPALIVDGIGSYITIH